MRNKNDYIGWRVLVKTTKYNSESQIVKIKMVKCFSSEINKSEKRK